MRYLIVGSDIAAVGAVEGIRRFDRRGEITVLDGEKRGAYTRPLISYYLSDPIHYADLSFRPDSFFRLNQVEMIKARGIKIDRRARILNLDNGMQLAYDRLLLACGASPAQLELSDLNQRWVSNFYTLEDVERLNMNIREGQQAVVIGSGLIGVKAAEALLKRGLRVTLVEKAQHILPQVLSPTAAARLGVYLEKAGIKIIAGDELAAVYPQHRIQLSSGTVLQSDQLIMAVGIRPNTELAFSAGLKVGKGIVADSYLRTSDEYIFAAGDVIETPNLITSNREIMALLPHAHREGYLAGANMSGQTLFYRGGVAMNSVKLQGWSLFAAGIPKPGASIFYWQEDDKYLEIHHHQNCLQKFIAINLPEVAGPLLSIIETQLPIPEKMWQEYVECYPTIANLPALYWQKIWKGEKNDSIEC